MKSFKATIDKIGINPFVFIPENTLKTIFRDAQKDKSPIPVCGTINGFPFIQTLVKYRGHWRLYINGPMLKDANKKVGDQISLTLSFDPAERSNPMHPKLTAAFTKNKKAHVVFETLPPSRQKEIIRYINHLKTEEAVDRNIERTIRFLSGKERFIGRDQP